MENVESASQTLPLINTVSSLEGGGTGAGTATPMQTLGNIMVSVVGTGILGLPYAFRIAGWLAGSIGVVVAGVATYYCMLLIIQCKDKIESEDEQDETKTYGDLGFKCMGRTGRYLTESLIFFSQCGGAVAYLVFIGQNLSSVFKAYDLSFASVIFILVPIEIALSWIGSLSALAPFSIFADICNMLAMFFVVKEDLKQAFSGEFSMSDRTAITSNFGGLPFAGGMAVFCFEGFGMTLALEGSMKERRSFPRLLAKAFTGITVLYALFGFAGYMAYGNQTEDIITLNLPKNWSTIAVQVSLCLGLTFTFPIMVHPMNEIIEGNLDRLMWFHKQEGNDSNVLMTKQRKSMIYLMRTVIVTGVAVVASFIPGFGMFASLVGSTVCALISFVLPALFHLRVFGPSLSLWYRAPDILILSCGMLFAVYGTYNATVGV